MNYYRELFKVMEDQSRIERHLYQLIERTEIIERYARQDTLEINGVPEENLEDILNIIRRLSRQVSNEITIDDIYALKRIKSRNPRPIIVKFANRTIRDRLISAVTRFNYANPNNKLNSGHLGFDGFKIPILLSSHPSRMNRIHREQTRKVASIDKANMNGVTYRAGYSVLHSVQQRRKEVESLRDLALTAVNNEDAPKP